MGMVGVRVGIGESQSVAQCLRGTVVMGGVVSRIICHIRDVWGMCDRSLQFLYYATITTTAILVYNIGANNLIKFKSTMVHTQKSNH